MRLQARTDGLSEAVKKSRDYYSLVTKEDEDDNENGGSSNVRFVTQKVRDLVFPPEFIALCAGQYMQHNDPVLIPHCRSALVTGSSSQSTPSRSTPIPQSFSLPPKAKSGPVGSQSLALQAAPSNGSLLGVRSFSSVGNCNPYLRTVFGDVQNGSITPTATCEADGREPETQTERDTTITSWSYQAQPEVRAIVSPANSTSPSNALQATAALAREPHASAVMAAMLEHEPDWLPNDLEREQRAPAVRSAPAQPHSLQLPSSAIHPSMPPSLPITSSRSGSGSTTSNGAAHRAGSSRMKPLTGEQRAKLDMVLGSLPTTDAEPLTFVAEQTSPPGESRGELGQQADNSRLLSETQADERSEHSSEVTSASDMNPKPLCDTCDTILLLLRYYVYTLLRHDASNESAFEYSFNNSANNSLISVLFATCFVLVVAPHKYRIFHHLKLRIIIQYVNLHDTVQEILSENRFNRTLKETTNKE